MFPLSCGSDLERSVQAGIDPLFVVLDEWMVIRGGLRPMPATGTPFPAVVGPDMLATACAVPYGNVRWAQVGVIRSTRGTVEWIPEHSWHGTMNLQHVNVIEISLRSFLGEIPVQEVIFDDTRRKQIAADSLVNLLRSVAQTTA